MPYPEKAGAHDEASVREIYGVTQADKDAAFEALVKTMVNAATAPNDLSLQASFNELITDMAARYSTEQFNEAVRLASKQISQKNTSSTLDT